MIIVLKPDIKDKEIQHVLDVVKDMGFQTQLSRGVRRTIIGVIGEEDKLRVTPLEAIAGVEKVIPVLAPYKLASREFKKEDSVVDVKGVKVGGDYFACIAGPCSVENHDLLFEIARDVKHAGAKILRGGAFKPRTSPYSFRGLGKEALEYLAECGKELKMPVATEVMDTRDVELVAQYADILQIGARNMQNFNLLTEVGKTSKPILLKRGMSSTVKDLLMSAEYILTEGNNDVILCERGVRTFEDSVRNMLDLSCVPNVKSLSHLPIIVDPSHATGRWDLIAPMARAAVASGADGVMVEVHPRPAQALSDGNQSLKPEKFAEMMKDVDKLVELMGKKM